ncbi:MAG: signal peptide peptidase SppA [Pseudomonadota bacterium]
MAATADLIIERRQMRRRLALWRILAIVAVVGAVVVGIASFRGVSSSGPTSSDNIARIKIDGIITSDFDRDEELAEIAEDDAVKALIVRINSPGGTIAGSEALYEGLRSISEKKPVVAVMVEAAASGGYIAALAADHIVALGNTLTGSIGVVAEAPNIARLLQENGVDVFKVKSTPLKAEPGFLTEPADGAVAAQQILIDDTFAWFRGLVAERRGLADPALSEVADGRAYTGRMALELDLIDAIGDEETAKAWLTAEHEIPANTKVVDRDWRKPDPTTLLSLITGGAVKLGLASPDWRDVAPRLGPGPKLYAIMY